MQTHISSGPPPYAGRCLCGHVEYLLLKEPRTFYACHCTDCQKRSGSAFRLVMPVDRDALVVTKGDTALKVFASNGRSRRARACPHCDTRLWAEPADRPAEALVLPGTLDRGSEFTPIAHLWTRSTAGWISFPADAVRYDTHPPDGMNELIRLWQARSRGD